MEFNEKVHQYSDVVTVHGPDSDEAKELYALFVKDDPEFRELAHGIVLLHEAVLESHANRPFRKFLDKLSRLWYYAK